MNNLEVEIKGWSISAPTWSEAHSRSLRQAAPAQQGRVRERGSASLGSHQGTAGPGKGWGQAQELPRILGKVIHYLRVLDAVDQSF